MKTKIITTIIAVAFGGIGFFAGQNFVCESKAETPELTKVEALASWNSDSNGVRNKILSYLQKVTSDSTSPDFIPPEDRIATFDMDGTFLTERPFAMDYLVVEYRIRKELSDNKILNSKLDTLLQNIGPSYIFEDDDYDYLDNLKKEAFANVPEDSIVQTAYKFMKTDVKDSVKFSGYRNVDLFYKPMLELFAELQRNKFKVFVVSGSDRSVVWGCIKALKEEYPEYNLELERLNLIGSDWELKAQNDSLGDGGYIFNIGEQVSRGGKTLATSIKMQKVINIYRQVGKYPVFSGGNTDGDFSMLNMALSNTSKNRMSIFIWHDDDREYVYNMDEKWEEKAQKYGWTLVSLKNEFKNIFVKK